MRGAAIATVGALTLWCGSAAAQPSAAPPTAAPRTDEIWRLYDQAFAALLRSEVDEAGRLIRRLVDDHGPHPAAVPARDLIAELDGRALEPQIDVVVRPRGPEAPSSGARAELTLFQTIHGLAIGAELCVAVECEQAEGVVVLMILGGSLGAGVSLGLGADVTPGKRALLNSGTAWGAFNAGMVLAITGPDDGSTYGVTLIGGQALGLLIGAAVHRSHPTSGQVGIANTVGMWSGAVAAGVMAARDADATDTMTATMLVADAGLIAGALLAIRVPEASRAQSLVIDAGGIVGALGGAGIGVMITDDADQTTYAMATAGAVIGLGLAAYLTRRWSQVDAPPVRAAITPTDGGALASVALDL